VIVTKSKLRDRKPPLRLNRFLPFLRLLRSVGVFRTDASGLRIVQAWPLKMGPIRSPETSVLNHPKLRYIPEDERSQIKNTLFKAIRPN
jgi:hypothetical protein